MRSTTKDVAIAAGVSLATVDRVLNDRAGVRHDTVQTESTKPLKSLALPATSLPRIWHGAKAIAFLFLLPRTGDQFLEVLIARIAEANLAFAGEMVQADVLRIHES